MKKEQILNFLKSKDIWFWIAAAMLMALLAFVLHDCAYALAAVIPTASGRIISGTPLTTEITREYSKELLMNEVDKRITKVRPMSTPIDQLSRYAGARKSGSMIVDYYSVDVKPTKAILAEAYTEPASGSATIAAQKVQITTSNNDFFEVS